MPIKLLLLLSNWQTHESYVFDINDINEWPKATRNYDLDVYNA